MPNFTTAASLLTQISSIQWATQSVQQNRAKINRLCNGDAPWTEAERRANRLMTNINWLEAPRIVKNSAYQLTNAFFGPGDYFTITLDTYSRIPQWKRDQWASCLTSYINKALRESDLFESTIEQAIASVVLHGPAPSLWRKAHSVVPECAGVDDVMVPAGTLVDMSNLNFFAIYRQWTWAQLRDMAKGGAVDKGWNTKYVDALLRSLYKQPLQPLYQGNRWMFPEKIAEDWKENDNTYAAAAMGNALAWDCYFLDEDSGKWNRRILLDYNNLTPEGVANEMKQSAPEFLFERDNFADDWRHIIHWFIGNCSTVAPFRYYSVRSIGYQLYGPAFAQNMARCRTMDHVLQSLLVWFRNVSEEDRERLEEIQLHHLGIFPDGASMVTANERYTADWNLVGNFLQGNRQLMAESSAAYLPPLAVEGDKPAKTATQVIAEQNSAVTLTSSVQSMLYRQARAFFKEVVRRICLKDERDPITKSVLKRMKLEQIPPFVLDEELIEVTPNRVMGGGNRAVELTTARALFEAKGTFPPAAWQIIDRKYALALTNDPELVRAMLPDVPQVSATSVAAQNAFGTLMQGVPFQQSLTINELEYVGTLIQMAAEAMQPLEQLQQEPNGMPIVAGKVAGLMSVIQHIEQHIQLLSQNPMAKEPVRDYQRTVIQMAQQLRAYAQRLGEMEQAQSGPGSIDAKVQAQVQAMQTVAQAKAQVLTGTAQIKNQHKDAAFLAEQQRKDAQTVAEIRRKDVLTHADVAAKDLTTTADLVHQAHQARLDHVVGVVGAAQDHAQAQQEHEQGLVHAHQEHRLGLAHTQQEHEQAMAQAGDQHEQQLEQGGAAHEQELEQGKAKHAQDLQAAKAKTAIAKAKKPAARK